MAVNRVQEKREEVSSSCWCRSSPPMIGQHARQMSNYLKRIRMCRILPGDYYSQMNGLTYMQRECTPLEQAIVERMYASRELVHLGGFLANTARLRALQRGEITMEALRAFAAAREHVGRDNYSLPERRFVLYSRMDEAYVDRLHEHYSGVCQLRGKHSIGGGDNNNATGTRAYAVGIAFVSYPSPHCVHVISLNFGMFYPCIVWVAACIEEIRNQILMTSTPRDRTFVDWIDMTAVGQVEFVALQMCGFTQRRSTPSLDMLWRREYLPSDSFEQRLRTCALRTGFAEYYHQHRKRNGGGGGGKIVYDDNNNNNNREEEEEEEMTKKIPSSPLLSLLRDHRGAGDDGTDYNKAVNHLSQVCFMRYLLNPLRATAHFCEHLYELSQQHHHHHHRAGGGGALKIGGGEDNAFCRYMQQQNWLELNDTQLYVLLESVLGVDRLDAERVVDEINMQREQAFEERLRAMLVHRLALDADRAATLATKEMIELARERKYSAEHFYATTTTTTTTTK